ncbi:hypothetical protein OsJ_26693 [Oryza sativa Japonica Group]|uniref:Uncharacterized protein n=1 Tax=Oryza sativa subsp. japonica TaxID=39947 RepID=B9G005_ORYSJ|nr:hypothetical protein OsJ_26693 [Oryza sativa Japonica Group]
MGGETTGVSGGGFRRRLEYYLYSGEKKHVVAGIAIFAAIFGVPWYFMSRASFDSFRMKEAYACALGTKHQSHQDYMEKANKARSERLSSGQSSAPKA